jgi:hypothetical protein
MATVRIKIPVWLDLFFSLPLLIYRRFRHGDPFRRIYLGDDKWALVSPKDYYQLADYNWYLAGNGKEFYAFRNVKIGPGKTKMVSMHRQIMQDELSAKRYTLKAKLVVDHKDNNTLNNQRPNLRLATHSQNAFNRAKIKTKTSSRYIGVYFEKATRRYTVKIRTGRGKRLWLGRFNSEIEAAEAYDAAARKYHKEFAVLNFPRSEV